MDSLLELFYDVDDFCQAFLPFWNQQRIASWQKQRQRARSLSISEIITILIAFHQSYYRDFKTQYSQQVLKSWRSEFPALLSYTRIVEYIRSVLVPLIVYLHTCSLGECTGVSFTSSTALDVCLNQRVFCHRVLAGLAARGRSSMGWFFGFKLHLVINDGGEILCFCMTPGNIDDRKPVPGLAKQLFGKLVGDKGYISQIEHSRHRRFPNFFVNVLCSLIVYCRRPSKPSLGLDNSLPLPA